MHWENKRRLAKLDDFRELLIQYFRQYSDSIIGRRTRSKESRNVNVDGRSNINRSLVEIHDILVSSGVTPYIKYSPPPAIGGYSEHVDVIMNLFNLENFTISYETPLDFIDCSIGIYERNKRPAFLRLFNPFFYLDLVFDWLAGLPFVLWDKVGFNRQRAEESIVGRLIKGLFYLITVLASFLTVLHLLGWLEPVKERVQELIHIK